MKSKKPKPFKTKFKKGSPNALTKWDEFHFGQSEEYYLSRSRDSIFGSDYVKFSEWFLLHYMVIRDKISKTSFSRRYINDPVALQQKAEQILALRKKR